MIVSKAIQLCLDKLCNASTKYFGSVLKTGMMTEIRLGWALGPKSELHSSHGRVVADEINSLTINIESKREFMIKMNQLTVNTMQLSEKDKRKLTTKNIVIELMYIFKKHIGVNKAIYKDDLFEEIMSAKTLGSDPQPSGSITTEMLEMKGRR
jgi:hypothetical protein